MRVSSRESVVMVAHPTGVKKPVDDNVNNLLASVKHLLRSASRPNKDCAIADSTHVLAQERQRSVAGERCGRGVVRSALIAVESVVGGIDVDLRRRMRGRKFPHAVD